MRCEKCNVGLAGNMKYCPLCDAKAVNEKPEVEYPSIPYPDYTKTLPQVKQSPVLKICRTPVSLIFIIQAVFCAAGLVSDNGLLITFAGILGVLWSLILLICGIADKSKLTHSGVPLVKMALTECVYLIFILATHSNIIIGANALLTVLASFVALLLIKPTESKNMLRAYFRAKKN